MYDKLVLIQEQFNYSANVQLDMDNSEKLLHYIPNDTSVKLLKDYFVDIVKDSPDSHSHMIYGSYGTGKSHFLTVLSMLLSKQFVNDIAFKTFIDRLRTKDRLLVNDIKSFEKDNRKKPFLVVPIVFDFPDFNRCLFFSLQKVLLKQGINIVFKTFYHQAVDVMKNWMNNPTSADRLASACANNRTTADKLLESLNRMDTKAEKKFLKVFSEVTYGVKFVCEVASIVDAIDQVNEVTQNRYAGIVFIFDEFGRYMEDNLKSIKVSQIQQLSEYCDHGDGNNHIILVSHKEISQYTKEHGQKLAEEWKKVERRFRPFTMNSEKDQSLFFAENVLYKKADVWNQFSRRFSKELENVYTQAMEFNAYNVKIDKENNPYAACFPLHPISLFALDKLSKKVAQNERTFFTFLSSKEANTLYSFLTTTPLEEFHIVGLDYIYDYFESSIKSMQSDSSYEWFRKLQIAVNKLPQGTADDSFEVKILKAIAVVGIVGTANVLPATREVFHCAIDGDNAEIDEAVSTLIERRLIKFSGITGTFDFYNSSTINIDELIDENLNAANDEAIVKVLNDDFVDFVVYPYDYNDEYKITRVFAPVFYSAALPEIMLTSRINRLECDGTLVMTLANDEHMNNIAELSANMNRTIFYVNTNTSELIEAVRRYIALKYIDTVKSKYTAKDPAFEQELDYCLNEQSALVKKHIESWKNSADNTTVIAGGQIHESGSMSDISDIASELMRNVYPDTLIVNNELVNKNTLTGTMTSSRRNAVEAILSGKDKQAYFGLADLSPDYIFVRSVLAKNDLYHDNDIHYINARRDNEHPQDKINDVFSRFCNTAREASVGFDELVNVLTEPPYGLRKGYLPLLIAYMLVGYKTEMVINSHDVGQEITADLFDKIVARPADYTFSIEHLTDEQKLFANNIEKLFNGYLDRTTYSKSRMKALYDAAFKHYKSVSKFARTTEMFVSEPTMRYRKLMEKNNTNYSRFVLRDLKSLTGDYESAIEMLRTTVNELNTAIDRLKEKINSTIAGAVGAPENELIPYLRKLYMSEWEKKRKKSFDFSTNAFLDIVAQVNDDTNSDDFIRAVTKRVSGLEYSFWSDSHVDDFMMAIHKIVDTINSYDPNVARSETETMVTIANQNGSKSVLFDNSEMDNFAITAKNKMAAVFDNFGLSLSHDNKVQIVLSLLNDLMEGK